MTNEEIFKLGLEISGREHEKSKYVYLRKDDKGYFIEYAFIPGAPHDNRCLSKYVTGIDKINTPMPVDKLYRLSHFTCGGEDGDGECKVGSPNPSCSYCAGRWSYNSPHKCACWHLRVIQEIRLDLTVSQIRELTEIIYNDTGNNGESPIG